MNKFVLCFLTVFIVSARCSAESIPALRKTSDIAAHSTRADEYSNQKTRETPNEERVDESFAIESFITAIEITAESIPASIRTAITMDVSQMKTKNTELAGRMEKLGINVNGVVALAKALSSKLPFKKFSVNNLEWMILGKVYFEKAGSSTPYRSMYPKTMFKEAKIGIREDTAIKKWIEKINMINGIRTKDMAGKMIWLLRHHDELELHLEDVAKMAFGSEYFEKLKEWVISDRIMKAVSEHGVANQRVFKYLKRFDEDPKWKDLTGKELLDKATHDYLADELQKEPNAKRRRVA